MPRKGGVSGTDIGCLKKRLEENNKSAGLRP